MFVLCKWYCFCVMSHNIIQLDWNESVHVCSICGNIQYSCCILISQLFFKYGSKWKQSFDWQISNVVATSNMAAAFWFVNYFQIWHQIKATIWLVNIPIWWQHPIMKTAIWLANIPIWWQHPIWLLYSDWSTIFQIWHQIKATIWLAN